MRQETAALRDFSPVFVRYGSEADEATLSGYVRFTPKSAQRAMRLACPLCADCVAKVFLAFGRETLIQDRTRTSNNDSKEPTLRFDCYKFLFHRACLATFATQSAKSRHSHCNTFSYSITSSAAVSKPGGTSSPSALAAQPAQKARPL